MKKLILVCILCLSLVSLANGENYVSKDFPSDQILQNNYFKLNKRNIGSFVGKYQGADGTYHVLISNSNQNLPYQERYLERISLRKLDTNVWIVTFPGYGAPYILEK